jgi:predicted nucleic acid-binding protein
MVMKDAEPLFIDTNILIYANVATAPFHEQALNALRTAYQSKRHLWVSRQVLREFIVKDFKRFREIIRIEEI